MSAHATDVAASPKAIQHARSVHCIDECRIRWLDRRQGPQLRFRNYQPRSEELQGLQVAKPELPAVEEALSDVVHNDPAQEPLLNLAPKRPNWDLKRDLEPQMKRLRAQPIFAHDH